MIPDNSFSVPPPPPGGRVRDASTSKPLTPEDLIVGLPGEALVREGLADCQAGRHTIAACLVAIASSRLTGVGLLSAAQVLVIEPEIQLYRLLRQEGGDAYSKYNALIRELVSFESGLDRRLRQFGG